MTEKIKGIPEGDQPKELLKSLISVASDYGDDHVVDASKLEAFRLTGAMTNVVYRITWPKNETENGERTVLARFYVDGSDTFFNRNDEIRILEEISTRGHGPKLLARFPDGRIEEFIHAKTLTSSDIRDPETSTLIAKKLREFHGLEIKGSKNVVLWPTMRKWLIEARRLCSKENAEELRLDILLNEIDALENKLTKSHQDVSFCHNDLQYGNIMMDEKTRTIKLIDYEYAGYNPGAYDIANHFCEWAATYDSKTSVLDFNKYPGLEERKRFVQSYLSATGNQPSDTEVDEFIDNVEKYTLANHLFWGLWGIISKYVTRIDFDYIEYAKQRFSQYWLRKAQLLKE